MTRLGGFDEAFAALDTPRLRPLREEAFERFARGGFPSKKSEAWRYTGLDEIASGRFATARGVPRAIPGVERLGLVTPGQARIVLVDGVFARELSTSPRGFSVAPLGEAVATRDALAEEVFAPREAGAEPFATLNAAFLTDGVWLDVPAGRDAGEVHLLHLSSGQIGGASHPRVRVTVGAGSDIVLLESFVAIDDGHHLTNTVTELWLDAGARVTHARLQDQPSAAYHVGAQRLELGRDATYRGHQIDLGAGLSRLSTHALLSGPGASAALYGAAVGSDDRHVDSHLVVEHGAPHTESDQRFKAVLDGRATSAFSGRVVVHPGASETKAAQKNQSLLLSKNARAFTRPQLEINHDDVACSHGATVGALDPDQLFYLRARGIEEAAARRMLTGAFLADVIDAIPSGALREGVGRMIQARLEG